MGLIKTKRSHVAMNCSAIPGGITPTEYSALVIVELFPILKLLKKDEDATEYQRLLTILESVRDQAKKHKYSKASLVKMVKDRFLSNLSIDDLKAIIKDSAFCQFPESLDLPMKFNGVSQHPPQLRIDYGQEEYCQLVGVNKKGADEISSPVFLAQTTMLEVNQESTCVEQSVSPETRDTTMHNAQAEELLSTLQIAFEFRENAKHTWQWFLSAKEYDKIKGFVSTIVIPTPAKLDANFAQILRLYIGEFYKREWEGNNNPFRALGKSVNSEFKNYKLICEKTGLTAYTKINDTHLQTLYVDGGLPIHYISSKLDSNKSSLLIDCLSYLFETEDDGAIAEGEYKLGKSTSSTALRESYHQGTGHSIYEYINAIRDQKQTWNDADNSNLAFSGLIEKVKTARITQENRRKFKIQYSLWTCCDKDDLLEFSLIPSIRFRPIDENGNRHYAISTIKLQEWGIMLDSCQFELIVQNQSILFSWCYAGDYIAREMKTSIELLPISREDLSFEALIGPRIKIRSHQDNIDALLPENAIISSATNGVLQLYTNDDPSMALWQSNKANKSFHWSGVLFDKSRYTPYDSTIKVININLFFGWIVFEEEVELFDLKNKKRLAIFNRKDSLYASVERESLHPITDSALIVPTCITDKAFSYPILGRTRPVYFVKSKAIHFVVGNSETSEVYKQDIIDDAFTISYQPLFEFEKSSSRWLDYDRNSELEQGLYVFRVAFRSLSTTLFCYVLPEKSCLSTYLANVPHKIIFSNINNVESRDGLRKNDRNEFLIEKKEDYFNFTIDGIIVKTYNPTPQIHAYLNGREVYELPLPFAEEIRISIISSDGCSTYYLSDKEKVYKRLFDALTLTATRTGESALQPISLNTIDPSLDSRFCKGYSIRIYTQEITNSAQIENLFFLDLKDNTIAPMPEKYSIDYAKSFAQEHGDGLLFQSLVDGSQPGSFYAPKFISRKGIKANTESKTFKRRNRLDEYVEKRLWSNNYCYRQFDLACEHNLYFAIFDALLCLIWDKKKHEFYSRKRSVVIDRLAVFFSGYISYCKSSILDVNVHGLIRLAKEFQFDWNILSSKMDAFDSITTDYLKKLTT